MISAHHIYKAYRGQVVLDEINIDFPIRQVTSLIGPNGAGKSTLLMMLAHLSIPDQGQITLGQRNIAHISKAEYAKRVATLRQSPGLNLRMTVEELVAFGRFPHSQGHLNAQDHQVITESLDFLDLQPLRHAYVDELSGGQRQMAYLAMTIAQQTDVLLLDEPLNNLDMKHAVQLMRALRRLCDEQGRTVILVIHDINVAANYSDHIVALKHGKLCFSGPTQQVITAKLLGDLYELNFTIQHGQHGYYCSYFN
ncbi:ATP-binding cassette domain-containing protein [Acinetobacter rudis]|uniref:iron ABC transporter ATP-binding protein n=1 Tax=Acinetobacter rudis TaxID=632955 RepID=UPI00280CF28B|nr:ATP-binding cassette domain-containing protein [Acinetobacter rudis]MDQ8952352.1 ATP-binding cassette domain-containing protein [Acinetobacter rudis]